MFALQNLCFEAIFFGQLLGDIAQMRGRGVVGRHIAQLFAQYGTLGNGDGLGELLLLLGIRGFCGHQCDHAFGALCRFFGVLLGVLARVHAVRCFKGVGCIGGALDELIDRLLIQV